jgi:creatinine amidohydrolase
VKLASMSWPDVRTHAPDCVAMLPVAAVEQHGPHLPVTTDTDLVTAIASSAEARLEDQIVLCPTMPYGSSHHHLDFPGTLSIGPELFTRVVIDLVTSLVQSGFRRIIVLNGHGGNAIPVKQALAVLAQSQTSEVEIALATYWELGGPAFCGATPMESPALSHACEYETSMMLSVASPGVRMDRTQRANRPPFNNYIAWEDEAPSSGVTVVRRTEFLSSNGSSGEPQRATAEKGSHLLGAAVDALVTFTAAFAQWAPMESLRNA